MSLWLLFERNASPFTPNPEKNFGKFLFGQESESEEENNVLTDISELSVQEVKLCLKECLGVEGTGIRNFRK